MGTCTVAVSQHEYARRGLPKGAPTRGYDPKLGAYVDVVVTASSSYATGGDTIPLTGLPLKRVTAAMLWISSTSSDEVTNDEVPSPQVIIGSSPKLKLYSAAATEATATTNYSTLSYRIRLFGPKV